MRAREENAIVLDFLKNGYSEDSRPLRVKEPILQVIGKEHFTLMELVPGPDKYFKSQDEVYIGEGTRTDIKFIKGLLEPDRLTQTAKSELPFVIEKLVGAKEELVVRWFNNCGPVSLWSHQFELLPGIGKKQAQLILNARQEKPFLSFEDIKQRTPISDPKRLIMQRIMDEINGKDRFRIFVGA